MEINIGLYRRYLQQYVAEAVKNSGGSNAEVAEYLQNIQVKGFLTRHRKEKQQALADARRAFNEHRHWPLDILLSHLGVDLSETGD